MSSFSEALKYYRRIDGKVGEVITLQHLSSVYRKKNIFDKAKTYCDDAWTIAKNLEDNDLQALVLTAYGKLARDMKNWKLAEEYFNRVKDWFENRTEQTPRDESLAIGTWGHLAISVYHLGQPEKAKELCLKSLEYFETRGTKGYLATLKYRLALAEEALGELEAALGHITEAVEWFERLGMKPDYEEAEVLLKRLKNNIIEGNDGKI